MNLDGMTWNPTVGCFDVGVVGDEIVSIVPMIYNHRVTVGPADDRLGYDHGWCYPSMAAAAIAVLDWDPATQPTPAGFIKQATPGMRTVPSPTGDAGVQPMPFEQVLSVLGAAKVAAAEPERSRHEPR